MARMEVAAMVIKVMMETTIMNEPTPHLHVRRPRQSNQRIWRFATLFRSSFQALGVIIVCESYEDSLAGFSHSTLCVSLPPLAQAAHRAFFFLMRGCGLRRVRPRLSLTACYPR